MNLSYSGVSNAVAVMPFAAKDSGVVDMDNPGVRVPAPGTVRQEALL